MPGDKLYALAGKLIGDRDGLFRIAGIVADFQHDLLAEHAAGLVDVGHGLFGAGLHLLAEGGVFAGHRAGGGDLDLRAGGGGENHRHADRCYGSQKRSFEHARILLRFLAARAMRLEKR